MKELTAPNIEVNQLYLGSIDMFLELSFKSAPKSAARPRRAF